MWDKAASGIWAEVIGTFPDQDFQSGSAFCTLFTFVPGWGGWWDQDVEGACISETSRWGQPLLTRGTCSGQLVLVRNKFLLSLSHYAIWGSSHYRSWVTLISTFLSTFCQLLAVPRSATYCFVSNARITQIGDSYWWNPHMLVSYIYGVPTAQKARY